MNKYKIVALFGPAGSGKDYILQHITQTDQYKINLHRLIPYTTRPPREGEKEGIPYHFLSKPEELIKQDLLEFTIFKNWWYGTPISSLDKNKINIGIFNIKALDQLINKDVLNRVDCLPIYIKTFSKIRLLRQLLRENNPDCDEIVRRYLADREDFHNLPFSYKIIENNYDEIQPVITDIFHLIKEKWS